MRGCKPSESWFWTLAMLSCLTGLHIRLNESIVSLSLTGERDEVVILPEKRAIAESPNASSSHQRTSTAPTATSCSPPLPVAVIESWPALPLQLTSNEQTTPWHKFLTGPALPSTPAKKQTAACVFFATAQSQHFPHALQQLYRCWSFWNANPHLAPVLVGPAHHRGFRPVQRPDLFTGLVAWMQETIGLQVVPSHNISSETTSPMHYSIMPQLDATMAEWANSTAGDNTFGATVRATFEYGDGFAFHRPQDARTLRQRLFPNMTSSTTCPSSSQPRIVILNRRLQSRRSLLQADELAHALSTRLPLADVSVQYLEGIQSARQQLQVLAQAHIVISPHGAQWSGMPVMPPCGTVVEVFTTGYYVPYFFGSLARAAGLAYKGLYASTQAGASWREETDAATRTVASRRQARRANLCLFLQPVVETIAESVEEWRSCCRSGA